MPEKNFGMRLAPRERTQIEQLASLLGVSMKEAVLEAVGHRLREERGSARPELTGRLSGASHLVGSMHSGLPDLASNPDHMDGYGA